jgi:MTH538 TIR-like domain (DUF1863)
MADGVLDLFITHAWRYHDDWTRVGEMLDKHLGDGWRNFSVPWYDPALDPNTDVGKQLVHRWLEQQIIPASGVILLSSVYQNKSAQKWVVLELELARKHGKRVIGLPAFGANEMPPEAAALVDARCPWDAKEVVAALQAVRGDSVRAKPDLEESQLMSDIQEKLLVLQQRLTPLEKTLEKTVQEGTARQKAMETLDERIHALGYDLNVKLQRLEALERTVEERSNRIATLERILATKRLRNIFGRGASAAKRMIGRY